MINNNFLYELGFGLRTREDTLFIFRTMYEKLVKEGLNDTTLGNIEYIRKELDKHREYISNKTYSIISMTTILQRIKDYNICEIPQDINIENIIPIPISLVFNQIESKVKNTGIYGIYIDDKLAYIGKITTSFEQRFKEHNKNINDTMYIHKLMREAKKDGLSVYMKPIITLEDLKMEGKKVINNKELECMELALITAYKPIGNIEGRIKPYVFRK